MSAPRPPAPSPQPARSQRERESIDELEELGDDAIISQQTAAHAPQPRANVSEEARSVVITEHPPDPQPARKSSAEATLVIRDRRALDEMRQKLLLRQQENRANRRNALYLWSALGLAAFILGGIVAFLATDTQPVAPVEIPQKH
ncbi:MAG TPA: hypothetical protein VHM25_17220 [Polyangiaceae bacterium]|nr:hypothetical protein [Polyangiaceae bacterium]